MRLSIANHKVGSVLNQVSIMGTDELYIVELIVVVPKAIYD